jgi:hypothetical protein
MLDIDGTSFSRVGTATADGLTNAYVVHPVAFGLAFIAGLCAIGGWVGSLIATLIAGQALKSLIGTSSSHLILDNRFSPCPIKKSMLQDGK